MNAEHLHDAISLLPEEMLLDVDQLRQKKRTSWKPVVALAACLCLVAGLWVLQNSGASAENGSAAMERFPTISAAGDNEHSAESGQTTPMPAVIAEVFADRILVFPGKIPSQLGREPVTVMLTELETVPELSVNQRILIYYEEVTDPLVAVRIETIVE